MTRDAIDVQGDVVIPRGHLEPLVLRLRMTALEWRVTIAVLVAPEPITARQLSKLLRLDYSAVKRVVRGLIAWRVLVASPAGLLFQPDYTRWNEPNDGMKRPILASQRRVP